LAKEENFNSLEEPVSTTIVKTISFKNLDEGFENDWL
jgi:hypothetical protein